MSKFFKEIQKYNWIKNTIFIITADHTSPESFNNAYKSSISRYSIPLIIFKGDSTLKGINTNTVQQIDIMPTVYELINYNKPYFAFGKSMFNDSWAVNFLQNKYRFISDEKTIVNKQEEYSSFTNSERKNHLSIDTKDLNLLKAIKQQYNHRMLNNKLTYED